MSGSWESSKYDNDNYEDVLQTNNRRINLIMENPGICAPCRVPEPGFLGSVGVSTEPDRPMIDVESDLLMLGRGNNRGRGWKPTCPKQYLTNGGDGYPCGGGVTKGNEACQPRLKHLPECTFGQIDSRTVVPSCTLRGTGWDRWDPLCRDPTELTAIEFPGESNVNWRMVCKDNFKKCALTPWDQTAALPKGSQDIPCQRINGVECAAFTGDLSPDRYSHPLPAGYTTRVR